MKAFIILFTLPLFLVLYSANASIEETCKQVTAKDTASYNLCLKALNTPKNQKANREDLFAFASDLAIDSFHRNLGTIQELQEDNGLPQMQEEALRLCFAAYKKGISMIEHIFFRSKLGGSDLASKCVTAAMAQVQSCTDTFVKEGTQSLLRTKNEEAMNLARLTSQLLSS